ncbi:hypothetical protein J2743_000108 [Methanobacterium petrolearium]|nr:hypothetical protein [Methanobacterium petrolearium]
MSFWPSQYCRISFVTLVVAMAKLLAPSYPAGSPISCVMLVIGSVESKVYPLSFY